MRSHGPTFRQLPSLSWFLLCALLGTLVLAGGSSRADVLGQVVVRAMAILVSIVAILFADRPDWRDLRPVCLLLGAAIGLSLVQLVPLPPSIWQALPDRALLAHAAEAAGFAQPWRPWSIVPGATINALASLVVPAATLLVVAGLRARERGWLLVLTLSVVCGSALLGVLQFSGAGLDNPLINDDPSSVSGSLANRNHFALLLAMGCLMAPVWAIRRRHGVRWRALLALALVLLFVLMILASGSRSGMISGLLGLVIGLLLAGGSIKRDVFARLSRSTSLALIATIIGLVVVAVLVSLYAGRAISVDRAIALDPEQDFRRRSLPAILAMVRTYFPLGYGLGAFDPAFRIHEPFDLLATVYLNLAHDDLLQVVLDSGLPGLLLLLGALAWWGWASVRAWRSTPTERTLEARLGSAALLLIVIASLSDYPARTPMMMAMVVICAVWLSGTGKRSTETARTEDPSNADKAPARRGAPRRGRAAWVKRGALAASCCLLGYPIVAQSLAYPMRTANPQAAHALAPWDGRITAALAQSSLIARTGVDPARAVRLAREALRQDPTAVDALVGLGVDAESHGDVRRARRIFAYAQALSRRNLNVQLWFVEDAVRRGDVAGALRNYDIALRTSTRAPDLMFPVLAAAIAEPQVRGEMVRTLRGRPAWSNAFTEYLANDGLDPRPAASLFLRLHDLGLPVLPSSQAKVIAALVNGKLTQEAWTYYAAIRPGTDRRRSRDPRFSADLAQPTLFDWTPVNDAGITTSLGRAADGGVFDFSAPATIGGLLLSQMQMLPSGAYSLRGRSTGIDQPGDALPFWQLTCQDGRELGRVNVTNSARGTSPFTGIFVVPADCPVQTLSLMARPSESTGGLAGQIGLVQLSPAR